MGVRYLRRITATWVLFGLGVGGFTLWGPKFSAIVRVQPDAASGIFAQLSAGFTTGNTYTQSFPQPSGTSRTAHLIRTPARTIDPMLGWRLRWGRNAFIEAAAGYSFNLAGTVMQDTHQTQVAINPKQITFDRAGGGAAALSYGWLF